MKKIHSQTVVRTEKQRETLYLLILITVPVILFLLRSRGGNLAGSSIDWLGQHSALPDYFRKLFYETGNLFPDFAGEIGGGQNIYNFAYYGLYNPFYLFSYLLPFVKMTVYLQGLMLLEHIADGVLFYFWISRRHYGKWSGFFGALCLELSASVIYHTVGQVMFVNYMPFLLLALIGYDRYEENGKYGLLTVSVFLMILTSFYFAVGGVVVLGIYAVSRTFDIRRLWHGLYPVLLGCCLSLFYLLPVYCAMTAGRGERASFSIKELLTPGFELHKVLYSAYGIGLSMMALIILCCSIFYGKCRERRIAGFLGLLLVFPVFEWLLNGGLYLREKAFLPFLPLVCWLICAFLQRARAHQLEKKELLGGFTLAGICVLSALWKHTYIRQEIYLIVIEAVLCAVAFLLFSYKKKETVSLLLIFVLGVLGAGQISYYQDKMVSADSMEQIENKDLNNAVSQVMEQNKGNYRMETRGGYETDKQRQNRIAAAGQNLTTAYSSIYNEAYMEFRRNIFNLNKPSRNILMMDATDNPIFLQMMGVKYLIGQKVPENYEKLSQTGSMNLYENKQAAPIAYTTDRIISKTKYEKLKFPECQLAFLSAAVVDEQLTDTEKTIEAEKTEAELSEIKPGEGGTLKLQKALEKDGYLFVSFDVVNEHPAKDMVITINGEINKLSGKTAVYYNKNETFHYTSLLSAGTTEVPVEFGEGKYQIKNLKVWTAERRAEESEQLYSHPVNLKKNRSGNIFAGTANSTTDGWMITSIPYDENFTVLVDGKKEKIQKVNEGFVGIPIKKGEHKIKLIYHAKGKRAGAAGSGITLLVIGLDIFRKRR